MSTPLVPEEDLYARLEVTVDASPEAIELAWRALLKRHHPDVAGNDDAATDRAKRINVAHDWLSDPELRARYDAERLGLGPIARGGSGARRPGYRPRVSRQPWARQPGSRATAPEGSRKSTRPDLVRGEPAERLARFLARVERLTRDELDRLAAAEPPPIAFLATVRRFLPPEARTAFAATEADLVRRVPAQRWAEVGLREGLLGVAAELSLSAFLDDLLAEPFRGRARERLLRAWDASLDQPRYGPNTAGVLLLRDRAAALTRVELAALLRASQGIAGDDRPWPEALDREEDEALRISAHLAANDVAAAVPVEGLAPATAQRVRRLAERTGHVTALRHAFPPAIYAALIAPWTAATGAGTGAGPGAAGEGRSGPDVRRAR
ncbi:MAG TPA: J domain-containing protein [Candidatus Limnocylindrales bacterium]|nr:J domain-containing protein [Candidatus Limnocylindrales bacterium]